MTSIIFGEIADRIECHGKFFRLQETKWYAKGFTYGPFRPNSAGESLPEDAQVHRDFAHMREMGANSVRTYFPPTLQMLDIAMEHELRVLIDVPWEKHRCFFEDWDASQSARNEIRKVSRTLGTHPAVFAISVVNEFPNDIVRFYGHQRLEKFVDELLDIVHQESPACLATFANFPTTEFLQPENVDFHCFNVYLHDAATLGAYLDRLQHLAGTKPLILGEYGIDSIRQGEEAQAEFLYEHVDSVFSHGLAGSFVFAYTDDWFTGGHQIEDWEFGVTRVDRTEKPAATGLRESWQQVPEKLLPEEPPMVSVVVCSYNGGRTLLECLESLANLNYPKYEVILVNDGSTDATAEIAQKYPFVRKIHQQNFGLSVARNVGMRAALGEIVAYTDDDCVADEYWLLYLVRGMQDQCVAAIGGPNITPTNDNWIARCVSVSPGNPSHVMLDDRRAEHVPGCNMAFQREVLLELGGFDAQYRAAGDDVDLCWRLLDEGYEIGFAPGALVWHHRRCTVKAYLKQQKGYGRAEAMVQFKHPQRFGRSGNPTFNGVVYGDGAHGLPVMPPRIYHGQFGSAPFQTIYRQQVNTFRAWVTSLEWHVLALCFVLLGFHNAWWTSISIVMWSLTLFAAFRAGFEARLPRQKPMWCRPLVMYLHLAQPVVRGWNRLWYRWANKQLPRLEGAFTPAIQKPISLSTHDMYWDSQTGVGREQLLMELVNEARDCRWPGDFHGGWVEWDVELVGDVWHTIHIRTATEELGWPHRYTRARCTVTLTDTARFSAMFLMIWFAAGLLTVSKWGLVLGGLGMLGVVLTLTVSRWRCLNAVKILLNRAAHRAGLCDPPDVPAPSKPTSLELPVPAEPQPALPYFSVPLRVHTNSHN